MSEIENLKIYGGATYTVGNQDIIANEWEAGVTYVKGKSYVIQEHRLYVCNVTHTSVEPFDATNWTEITVGEAIAANTTAIGDLSQLTTTDKSSLVGAVNEVVSTKATTGSAITFAPETGITATTTSAVINKTVLLNLTFSGSFTLNTWKKIGSMNVTPSISTIYVAGIHSSDGLYAGMIQIRSDKGIYFYPKTAISGTVGCTANFNIT